MSGLGEMALLRPLWLLALPALAAFALLLWRRQRGAGDWARVIDPALLAGLHAMGRIERAGPGAAGLAALLVAGLTALALSGPSVERRDAAAFRNLDGVVLVLDASPSATGGADWEGLRTMGRSGIAALGSRPGALVVFAGDAYVASDMTADTRQVGLTLSLVEEDTVLDPGSRPERGLRLAAEILEEAEVLAGDVVLLTDGGGVGRSTGNRRRDGEDDLRQRRPHVGELGSELAVAHGGIRLPDLHRLVQSSATQDAAQATHLLQMKAELLVAGGRPVEPSVTVGDEAVDGGAHRDDQHGHDRHRPRVGEAGGESMRRLCQSPPTDHHRCGVSGTLVTEASREVSPPDPALAFDAIGLLTASLSHGDAGPPGGGRS